MNAAREHFAAERKRVPKAEAAAVPRTQAAANDETAVSPRVHKFSVDGDPLAGMAIASAILFAIFAGLIATL